ncbi:hypothetical protein KIPE111705_06210 [Kibdelosporangium persicum]|uniref:hypothetical protein n=1 Tax=Kibdelosporangium persicum TaxID=2698649 RepID=UPI001565B02B|nr:hypothetical protein [Kibdelosporangium persicum]
MITTISNRDRAVLRAVAAGRCEISGQCLRIDGLTCCDQFAAMRLTQAGLITGSEREPARLTPTGQALLAAA